MQATATPDRSARASASPSTRPTPREILRDAVRGAVRAPSSHNTQPWLFRLVGDDALELYADRTRALPVVDPRDRELTISCGAALFHVRAALRGPGGIDAVSRILLRAVRHKPTGHRLDLGRSSEQHEMYQLGG